MPKKRFRKLTDRQIICLLKYHRPKLLKDIKKLGIRVEYLDKGIDRWVYRIGKKLVLKLEEYDRSSFIQTPSEIEKFNRVHTEKKFKNLRKHIPKILYSDVKSGIIVVPFYPRSLKYEDNEHEYQLLADHIGQCFPDAAADFHGGNFRYAEDGTMVCIDLGFSNARGKGYKKGTYE